MNLKEIIVEELEKAFYLCNITKVDIENGYQVNMDIIRNKKHKLFSEIADNIISKMDWQVVASGEVYDTCMSATPELHIGDKNLNHLFEKYQGKNIEIAIRVKE